MVTGQFVPEQRMAAVFVVENDLKESVSEYGSIIDSINQNTTFSDSLKQFVDEGLADKRDLAKRLFEESTKERLASLTNKEFEPAFYLLVYLLMQLEDISIEDLLSKDSKAVNLLLECTPSHEPTLRDRKALRPTTILSIFNTFFNMLPETSPNRTFLLETILNIVSRNKISFSLIQSAIGKNLLGWLKAASASNDKIRELFWLFISLDSAYSRASLDLIKTFSAEYPLSLEELHSLINFALSSPVVDVSFMINNNVASALNQNSSDALVKTFINYTNGSLLTSVPNSLSENVLAKSKIMALAKFFVQEGETKKNTFQYEDIPKDLVSSPSSFEKLLIDSIKAGVIEGKLNQVDETFYLVRVNRFICAGDDEKLAHDWDVIKKTLLNWKHSLENINEVVLNAKENIVNNNNAN